MQRNDDQRWRAPEAPATASAAAAPTAAAAAAAPPGTAALQQAALPVDAAKAPTHTAIEVDHSAEPARRVGCSAAAAHFFGKMAGRQERRMPVPSFVSIFFSWIGAFLGVLAVAGLNELLASHVDESDDNWLLVGSFGASAVLIYGAPRAARRRKRSPKTAAAFQLRASIQLCLRPLTHHTLADLAHP